MNPRRPSHQATQPTRDDTTSPTTVRAQIGSPEPAAQVLVVEAQAADLDATRTAFEGHDLALHPVRSITEAREALSSHRFDLVILRQGSSMQDDVTFIRECREQDANMRIVMLGDRARFDDAMSAIRAGACDYIVKPGRDSTFQHTLQRHLEEAGEERRRDATLNRLRRICRRLNESRYDVTQHIDELCNDLLTAYDELAGQLSHITTVTEFSAIIKQEMDVEDLLRTTLEYFLRRIGPMNAAVFLPGTGDEFTLGAYINYDCPKDASDFLLDQLADIIPHQVADQPDVLEFRTEQDVCNWLGDDADWLSRYHIVTFPCRHADECLAVFTLFRDRSAEFEHTFAPLMAALSKAFAKHLSHIIRVHHRHLPPDFDDDDDYEEDWKTGDGTDGLAA